MAHERTLRYYTQKDLFKPVISPHFHVVFHPLCLNLSNQDFDSSSSVSPPFA